MCFQTASDGRSPSTRPTVTMRPPRPYTRSGLNAYLKDLNPHKVQQSLWAEYTDNDYVYAILYFKICKNSSLPNFENYGVNCSLHDEKRDNLLISVCANGKSYQENFEIFGIYCRK